MPDVPLPAIRLYYEERGAGPPILLIHEAGSDARNWGSAPEELARFGRVIVYDRRGCSRSERPEPFQRTTQAEHADDAAALLDALGVAPAIVIGRSSGARFALHLVLRSPERVRALVLLEGVGRGLSPESDAALAGLAQRISTAVAGGDVAAAGEALLRSVLSDVGYEAAPKAMKTRLAENGPAIVAEVEGSKKEPIDPDQLRVITCPTLVVVAKDSLPWFRPMSETLAASLPNARLALVEGEHLITPADPQVVRFIRDNFGHPESPML